MSLHPWQELKTERLDVSVGGNAHYPDGRFDLHLVVKSDAATVDLKVNVPFVDIEVFLWRLARCYLQMCTRSSFRFIKPRGSLLEKLIQDEPWEPGGRGAG